MRLYMVTGSTSYGCEVQRHLVCKLDEDWAGVVAIGHDDVRQLII